MRNPSSALMQRSTHRYWGKIIDSPAGQLKLVASERGLAAILWENDNPRRVPLGEVIDSDDHSVLLEAERLVRG